MLCQTLIKRKKKKFAIVAFSNAQDLLYICKVELYFSKNYFGFNIVIFTPNKKVLSFISIKL